MPGADRPLKVLHVLRSPVGGLFRHVVDLSRAQAARGHQVGIVADLTTGGARAEAAFAALAPHLALGLTRVPMSRHIGSSDLSAQRHVVTRARAADVDVLHGHGAKGGAYARLASGRAIRVYTPHGGSLHYNRRSPVGLLYLTLEQVLMARTELFLFESHYGRDAFTAKIGTPASPVRVVHNGVTAEEFAAVVPAADETDLVFIGELRLLKGVDVLIKAIAMLTRDGRKVTATIVGEGPDRNAFEAEVARQHLDAAIRFVGAQPARAGFALGRLVVVPSRAESLPYIVLEAAAAGLPLIATRVGGIPEILGPDAADLVAQGDPAALARAIGAALANPAARADAAQRLQSRVRASFSVEVMTAAVLTAYRETLARRNG
jgi:glycosyltransferase involved in cell wall biosynthesis